MADEKVAGVNELYPKEEPDASYEEQKDPASNLRRGMSKSLMQGAFAKFGQAFTDTGDVRKDAKTRDSRLAPFIQAGSEVASALEGRWHQMEMDNFDNETVKPYVGQKRQLLDDYQRRSAAADVGIFEGPNGEPEQLDLTKSEDRLRAVRMRSQLTTRFYALATDMDLEFLGEVGKYTSNPLIVQRGEQLSKATSAAITESSNPEQLMAKENAHSEMRGREARAQAEMVQAKGAAAASASKNQPRSLNQALVHPDVGPAGIVPWLITDPNGVVVMQAKGGGASYVKAERDLAMGEILKDHPKWDKLGEEMTAALEAKEAQFVLGGALKMLQKMTTPEQFAQIKQEAPQFFEAEGAKDVAIVSDKRMGPTARKASVKVWKTHAENHIKEWFESTGNTGKIEDAMADLEQWLPAAIHRETDEPILAASTIARGEGTKRLVEEILEEVPTFIRKWAMSEGGSDIGAELNPEEARLQEIAGLRFGGKRGRAARGILRSQEKKRKEGLNLPK